MTQPPINERTGFVCHSVCWSLLQKMAQPKDIPLARWFEVCDSLPIPLRRATISWGHTYGGIVEIDNERCFPWDDRFRDKDFDNEPDPIMAAEPLSNQLADRLVAEALYHPIDHTSISPIITTQERDCFNQLSLEIRIKIAICLSTAGMLSIRQASKAFWPILDSQQFWASRFWFGAERSWFYEAYNRKIALD
jgi:hypothetical protein